jgi:hypothetical protein
MLLLLLLVVLVVLLGWCSLAAGSVVWERQV